IHMCGSAAPRVRAAAVRTAARCVALVRVLPKADCNVFPEYIFPELAPRATDPAVAVRLAYADSIALLTETAVRFLDQTQSMKEKEVTSINYESELSALHEMVRSTVSCLLTDSQAVVKRAVVDAGITKLCVFFGKQKANDIILSHMVTFLNDKEEEALRGCFFDRVVGVVAYVGHNAAPMLHPLLQQGLTDQSEWIIAKALRATSSLAALGLVPKQALCNLLSESAVYLAHPNLWIRHEVCGLVSCAAGLLNPIDVHCKVLPLVWPHLRHKLIQVDNENRFDGDTSAPRRTSSEKCSPSHKRYDCNLYCHRFKVEMAELLLESLAEPIPRNVLDAVLKYPDVDVLVETLRDRKSTRLMAKQGTVPQYSEMGQQLRNLFRRLASDGMTEHVENQLLAMSARLIKIQRCSTPQEPEAPGCLTLTNVDISKSVPLASNTETLVQQAPEKLFIPSPSRRHDKTSLLYNDSINMNTEWQHMFGHANEQTSTRYSMAPCRSELRNLTARMQQKFLKSVRCHEFTSDSNDEVIPPASWRPGNQLLAYLPEHRARVNQMVTLPAQKNLFASCSDDGTVRLSKSMYNRCAGGVVSIAACEAGQSLVAVTQEGSIFVLR
ncbi:hypothetical protein ACJJTC_008158, partial [Scirpophaga incertulas]